MAKETITIKKSDIPRARRTWGFDPTSRIVQIRTRYRRGSPNSRQYLEELYDETEGDDEEII